VAFNGHVIAEFAGMKNEAARVGIDRCDGLKFGRLANQEGVHREFADLAVDLKAEAMQKQDLEHQAQLGTSVGAFGFAFNIKPRCRNAPADHEG
jgi:hypothetical protein